MNGGWWSQTAARGPGFSQQLEEGCGFLQYIQPPSFSGCLYKPWTILTIFFTTNTVTSHSYKAWVSTVIELWPELLPRTFFPALGFWVTERWLSSPRVPGEVDCYSRRTAFFRCSRRCSCMRVQHKSQHIVHACSHQLSVCKGQNHHQLYN